MEVKIVREVCNSKEEVLIKASDTVRNIAHAIAMQKKSIVLTGEVSSEEFDVAFNRELEKAWAEIKDLDGMGYFKRVVGEALIEGQELEDIFGKVED